MNYWGWQGNRICIFIEKPNSSKHFTEVEKKWNSEVESLTEVPLMEARLKPKSG